MIRDTLNKLAQALWEIQQKNVAEDWTEARQRIVVCIALDEAEEALKEEHGS